MMQAGMEIQGEPRLVCLDRATGRENWVVGLSSAADIPKNEDEKAIRALSLSGSPLVVGDNVLVIGRSSKGGQGEDCYVLAFDLSNGRFRWACYIASSGMGPGIQMNGGAPFNTATENTSHLAYANGRVYVQTNLGALAALDAYSGTIVWLNIYPSDRSTASALNNPMMLGGGAFIKAATNSSQRLKPWMYNPVVVAENRLFMLPTEGNFLIIYDAGTGREEKRIDLDQIGRWEVLQSQTADKPTTLVGVKGDLLVLAGDSRLFCLDWRKYDEKTFPGADIDQVVWPSKVPGHIRGRCFMTADGVFVPADDRVRWLQLKDGRTIEEYPSGPQRTWEDGEEPGNVLVTSDHVVLAGANNVDIYTDLGIATAKLDKEILSAPSEPEPRLRYAEVMFAANKPDAALQRLDEGIQLLGGTGAMTAGGAARPENASSPMRSTSPPAVPATLTATIASSSSTIAPLPPRSRRSSRSTIAWPATATPKRQATTPSPPGSTRRSSLAPKPAPSPWWTRRKGRPSRPRKSPNGQSTTSSASAGRPFTSLISAPPQPTWPPLTTINRARKPAPPA